MTTIRLVPSTYYLSSSSYLSVSNATNMYNNTDNESYATVTNSRSSTSSYYVYVRGFNFDDIPSGAVINSFTVKLKARESGVSTSSSYKPYLANGTSAINGSCDAITTTASVYTFTGVSSSFEDIVEMGSNFGIRINCRRASKNTTSYVYIYGAEILVDYDIPTPRTITSSLVGNGTISPSGAYTTYDDQTYILTITPDNVSENVTVTKDGVDVTSALVAHGNEQTGEFTANDVTTSDIQSGSSYAEYAVGYSASSPSSSGSSNNMYASSGSTGYAEYSFDFSSIPNNVTIESLSADCYGHRESSTIDSTHVSNVAIVNNGTQISDVVDFSSTSDDTITVTANSTVSRSDLGNITLRHYVGYYGGLVRGITFKVTYSTGTGVNHYTYTYVVSGDATIVVTIGSSGGPTLHIKAGGTWKAVDKVYKKVNGAWVEQSDLASIFNTSYKYVNKS